MRNVTEEGIDAAKVSALSKDAAAKLKATVIEGELSAGG
jgi:hypothetical protein